MIKSVYEFSINKETEIDVKNETPDGVLITKEKVKIPVKIIFKKPSRAESEEADSVYMIEFSRLVRAGVLTKALLAKMYDEKSGVLSESFQDKYVQLYEKFFKTQSDYTEISLKSEKSEDDNNRMAELATQFANIQRELRALENSRENIFQNTADSKGENKTILWLVLFLTYIQYQDDKSPKPFFEGSNFDEKLSSYDKILEEDNNDFLLKVIDRISVLITLWYKGQIVSTLDFKNVEKNLDGDNEIASETETVTEPAVT